ncbi:hypothetical protein DSJ_22840 (plasmid) [Pantoea stewartii subsp. stewartii DC283]|uniref:Uncharacterized protein n=1 Tax=Pantoea stewartii subsp. stewartii DC283 TaxID=660596 RepID=A0ABM6KCY1_PANSE|nr:hypothetical protein DSJ_22840 [Pantoea stewartii subsp. stewartii DC283]
MFKRGQGSLSVYNKLITENRFFHIGKFLITIEFNRNIFIFLASIPYFRFSIFSDQIIKGLTCPYPFFLNPLKYFKFKFFILSSEFIPFITR